MADRTATVHFLHDVLGMHALRHEEFKEGCKAACNGPYSGMWSKTMMGYDSEASCRGGGRGGPSACWHVGALLARLQAGSCSLELVGKARPSSSVPA